MALADYRYCGVCCGQVFYDASLNYREGFDGVGPPYRVNGRDQYPTPELSAQYGRRLDHLGDWAVLCSSCAKTHRTAILPRTDT